MANSSAASRWCLHVCLMYQCCVLFIHQFPGSVNITREPCPTHAVGPLGNIGWQLLTRLVKVPAYPTRIQQKLHQLQLVPTTSFPKSTALLRGTAETPLVSSIPTRRNPNTKSAPLNSTCCRKPQSPSGERCPNLRSQLVHVPNAVQPV